MIRLIRNGLRGGASLLAYPIAERYECREVRNKIRAARAMLDTPFAARRTLARSRLADLVALAGAKVPYYRDLFARIGFDPESLRRDPAYLQDIPYLTKDIIREQGDRLLRDGRDGLRIHLAKTGGSTGPSAVIQYDQEAADWSSAITRLCRACIGNHHWRSELHFASEFPGKIPWRDSLRERAKEIAMNRYNVYFAQFTDAGLKKLWRDVCAVRPHLAHAHPSTMDQLAQYVERHGNFERPFDIFESSGELLSSEARARISRVFGCKVIDRYGLAEAGVVAYQLDPTVQAMRFLEFFAWPELDTTGSEDLTDVPEGAEAGELVITPLMNELMPLLRYRTGDQIVLRETEIGFEVPKIVGRIHDVVETAGGRFPTHYIQDVLDRMGMVREFQIMQDGEALTFFIVPEDHADKDLISGELQRLMKVPVEVLFVTQQSLKLTGHRQKFRHLVQPS